MDKIMNVMAVVMTGDEADVGKWIWIMVVVGVLLVAMAVVSVLAKKKKEQTQEDKVNSEDDNKQK